MLYGCYVCHFLVFDIYCRVCLLIAYLLCLAKLWNHYLKLTFTVAVVLLMVD